MNQLLKSMLCAAALLTLGMPSHAAGDPQAGQKKKFHVPGMPWYSRLSYCLS